jgi:oxygen-dependent protoporphyrinogen oxidase
MAARYGSLTRGVLAQKRNGASAPLFRSLKRGLQQLVTALSGAVEVIHGRAEAIEQGRVRVAGEWLEAPDIVLACEAHSAANLLGGRLAELLATVGYTSSTIVVFGFNAGDFVRRPEGFGFLIPKKERRSLVACTWVGTKFPHRVPEGKIVARCFVSGPDAQPDTVLRELQEAAGFRAEPEFSRVYHWPRAMAQYPVGHGERMKELASIVAASPGLHLVGNAYDGIGIPDCIRLGKAAAEKIQL